MHEPLQEYADSRGVTLRVDAHAGVLRGVKLIGLESANRRRYRPEALAAAVSLYEGAKVNVNHPKSDPLAPRDYRDRLGVVRQVEFRPGDGLYGNLHFNPKHELAEQLAWDAEHNPRNVGFSHNVLARLTRNGEQVLVEAITHVQSVDLVADPAATQGLFEQFTPEKAGDGIAGPQAGAPSTDDSTAASDGNEQLPASFSALTYESLLAYRPDLLEHHARDVTAPLHAQLQEAAAREAAQRARPRSTEQRNVLARNESTPTTARDFARAITAPQLLAAGGSRRS
jgi:hypothetical protein